MTISDSEQLARERRRANPTTRRLIELFEYATREAAKDESSDMAYMEHEHLVSAYQNGLNWWTNHDGGRVLYEAWRSYLTQLKRNGYGSETLQAVFDEERI
jgi:hypothetical protein